LRRDAGLPSPRKRRAPKHRSRRDRCPRIGMLLQIDGSKHHWLGEQRPELTLVAAIDDATGQVPGALFRPQEDAAGYFLLTRRIVERLGLPLSFYADRHSIFQSPKQATVQQQLAGERPRSQFGRLVDELGIELIPSYSPQGRGRIERLFGTFQDRLAKELVLAEISTLEEANQFVAEFLPRFNARFGQTPEVPESAYLPVPKGLDLEAVFCFQHTRTVRTDNTISFAGHPLQIPADRHRGTYARCRVEVRQHMDGRLSIWYQGRKLAVFEPAVAGPPQVGKFTPAVQRTEDQQANHTENGKLTKVVKKAKPKRDWRPAPDHPWRKPFKLTAKDKH
ncbi:MAG: ISNCY family transposase, partial [Anaerolineales bacterium]